MRYRSTKNTHALTSKSKGIANVLVWEIAIAEAGNHAKTYKTKGIWDTGASSSVITQEVLDHLLLPVKGARP
jgi:hypothetical protein